MQLGLGIDTGGTYTDSVLYDFSNKKIIAKAKALTTKENLHVGIINSLVKLPQDYFDKVTLVSLSTTLATNACVEDKGSRGHLVLLGYDEVIYDKLYRRYGLPHKKQITMVPGSHGQQGQIVTEPDWEQLKCKIDSIDKETDAYGISEYWGIRNPNFEIKAKALIREWTKKPVVSAHELSTEINSLKRASTTLLNAKLIPLIDKLICAVKDSMLEMGIKAQIMIVKGDGTLMSESYAKEHPVETLLSGPAASVIGGLKLTDVKDALILDVGGTTSDLAVVRDGLAVLAEEGVDIAKWRTGTRAIKIQTIGLGGDSIISFDKNNNITVGPRKAAPLSWSAANWPGIKNKLKAIYDERKWHTLSLAEFYYLIKKPDKTYELSDEEFHIIEALSAEPKSIEDLAAAVGSRPYFLNTERLESFGIIGRSALTPTDIMHVNGDYCSWDTEAARLGLYILADRLDIDPDQLSKLIFLKIKHKLYMLICGYLLKRNVIKSNDGLSGDTVKILNRSFETIDNIELQTAITTKLPLIGIGAPTHIFLDDVAKALGTSAIINEHAEVANAVGAITGSIIGEEIITIKPRYEVSGVSGYGCHGSSTFCEFDSYEAALNYAKIKAGDIASELAKNMGATSNVQVEIEVLEKKASAKDIKEGLLLETVVIGRGIGAQSFVKNE